MFIKNKIRLAKSYTLAWKAGFLLVANLIDDGKEDRWTEDQSIRIIIF